MRENRDPRFRFAMQETQNEFINQRRLAGATGSRETEDTCFSGLLFRFRQTLSFPDFFSGISVFDLSQLARQLHIGTRLAAAKRLVWSAVTLVHVIDHVRQRRSREKNLIDAVPPHNHLVVARDRAAAPAEKFDVISALFLQ